MRAAVRAIHAEVPRLEAQNSETRSRAPGPEARSAETQDTQKDRELELGLELSASRPPAAAASSAHAGLPPGSNLGTMFAVSAIPTPDEKQTQSSGIKLGDLLFARAGSGRVLETEWVALVDSIASGDQRALHALYDRLHRIVFTFILRIVKSPQSAEELTVDVFYDVWKRAATYDPTVGPVIGWVMNQARSRAIDRLRFEQRKKRTKRQPVGMDERTIANHAESELETDDSQRLMRTALLELPEAERQALETTYFAECSYAEAAVRLKQPVGTIKTRIRSALSTLRQALTAGPDKP